MNRLIAIIIIVVLFLVPRHAAADPAATIEWQPNSEEELSGYRVYYSTTSGDYEYGSESENLLADIPCTADDELCCSYEKAALPLDRYYFVVTAYCDACEDLSADDDAVAAWKFEADPGFVSDSIGTNTLTNSGADENDVTYNEGAQAATFVRANSDCMTLADAAQDAGFPWRYADGESTVKDFTVTFWIYVNTLPESENHFIVSKWGAAGNLRVFAIFLGWIDKDIGVAIGYNGGQNTEIVYHGGSLVVGRWYHVSVAYDATDKTANINVWDSVAAGEVAGTSWHYMENDIDARDVGLAIGCNAVDSSRYLDAVLDEVALFGRVVWSWETDNIRVGWLEGHEIESDPSNEVRSLESGLVITPHLDAGGILTIRLVPSGGNITIRK